MADRRPARHARRTAWLVGVLATTLGCHTVAERVDDPTIPRLQAVARLGTFQDDRLIEASGIVPATRRAATFWSLNDGGNAPLLFAHDSAGHTVGVVRVARAENRDWEALGSGPCPSGQCLYVGDVGDNGARQPTVRVYRVPEPLPSDTVTRPAEVVVVRYPDGPHDVEAMWVAPDSGVLLLSKRPGRDRENHLRPARVYRVAPEAWRAARSASPAAPSVAIAQLLDSLPITPEPGLVWGWITDAALSLPDSAGRRQLAVRTYGHVYRFEADAVTARPGRLLARCSLSPIGAGLLGEGVAWFPDGRLLFTNEGRQGALDAGRCP